MESGAGVSRAAPLTVVRSPCVRPVQAGVTNAVDMEDARNRVHKSTVDNPSRPGVDNAVVSVPTTCVSQTAAEIDGALSGGWSASCICLRLKRRASPCFSQTVHLPFVSVLLNNSSPTTVFSIQ